MYNANPTTLAATGGTVLAGAHGLWWLLAALALIAAGCAIMRIVPRKTDRD